MYVYVYYVPSISCMCVWLGDCWLWYMCMISWMIRPPCEITHQLAVGTQNCFSTRFYTPYILTLNKRPECTKMHQCQTIKNISGEGHGPLLRPLSHWEGDTPSPDPTPSAFLFLFIYDSNTGQLTPWPGLPPHLQYIAALPCESQKSKNATKFSCWTWHLI